MESFRQLHPSTGQNRFLVMSYPFARLDRRQTMTNVGLVGKKIRAGAKQQCPGCTSGSGSGLREANGRPAGTGDEDDYKKPGAPGIGLLMHTWYARRSSLVIELKANLSCKFQSLSFNLDVSIERIQKHYFGIYARPIFGYSSSPIGLSPTSPGCAPRSLPFPIESPKEAHSSLYPQHTSPFSR